MATFLATLIIDKFGRRMLLILSALFMILSMYGLGLYFWIQTTNPTLASSISPLPLVSVCVFFFSFSLGFGPIPWLMMSELFSPEAKGVASSISSATNWILAFFVTQFFVPIKNAVGKNSFSTYFTIWLNISLSYFFPGAAATFWFFATTLTFIMAFQVFFVPETRGKSLEGW